MLAYLLAGMGDAPLPMPLGVLRAVEKPTYESGLSRQIEEAVAKKGKGSLESLVSSGDTWVVE